jgi:hypothetical protein
MLLTIILASSLMIPFQLPPSAALLRFLTGSTCFGQLEIITNNTANALAKKLVGEGVVISHAAITTSSIATALFYDHGDTSIGMDSGIVSTNERAKTIDTTNITTGIDGNGITTAIAKLTSNNLSLPGCLDPANELHLPLIRLNDSIASEFDFRL